MAEPWETHASFSPEGEKATSSTHPLLAVRKMVNHLTRCVIQSYTSLTSLCPSVTARYVCSTYGTGTRGARRRTCAACRRWPRWYPPAFCQRLPKNHRNLIWIASNVSAVHQPQVSLLIGQYLLCARRTRHGEEAKHTLDGCSKHPDLEVT